MSTIYNLWFRSEERDKEQIWRSYRTREEAEAEAAKYNNDEPYWAPYDTVKTNQDWFDRSWGKWWIEEKDTTGMFEIPEKIDLRKLYTAEVTSTPRGNGWPATHVKILKHKLLEIDGKSQGIYSEWDSEVIYEYDRNYAFLSTFEPFRQNGHHYALISEKYVSTAVLDLESGKVIVEEDTKGFGFCPVEFYVPDWWDVHDDSEIPGSEYWTADDELPNGLYGFVMGCVWGDDSSWKLQYLDLSDISKGILRRDDRFGYVEVATSKDTSLRDHIKVWHDDEMVQVDVEMTFSLGTGKANQWTLDNLGRQEDHTTMVVNGTSNQEFNRLKEFLMRPCELIKRVYAKFNEEKFWEEGNDI